MRCSEVGSSKEGAGSRLLKSLEPTKRCKKLVERVTPPENEGGNNLTETTEGRRRQFVKERLVKGETLLAA